MSAVRRLVSVLWVGAFASAPATTQAQVDGIHLKLFPWAGYADFSHNVNLVDEPIYGGSLGLGFSRFVSIQGHLGLCPTETAHGFTHYALPYSSTIPAHDLDVLHYGGDLVFDIAPMSRFTPFLMAGWQEARLEYADRDSVPDPQYENGWEVGAGLKLHLLHRLAVRAEVRDAIWMFPKGTPLPAGDDPAHNFFYAAGLEVAIGGASTGDADGDGVSDHRDKCPNTPRGARVDARGCPIDSDNDGVPDGIDQCVNTPVGAAVDALGCPRDSDGDGVPDGIDQCADTPRGAAVDERGCERDSDGDGVPDRIDQCSGTPKGTRVDARGCALVIDTDNDGVPDDQDQCPFTPSNAKVDKVGCPIELTDREVELLDKGRITERNIHFETGKWTILPESQPILDEIGNILIQWPRLRIEIGGHADARGSDAYNLDLSSRRANAVLDYLVSKFPQITRDQYSARGYGERVPVASNQTIEGMARNRRVEFKVLNTEELKKERERRHLLQK